MVQNIIVYLIGVLVVVYIAVSVYRLITRRADPCSGCAGCDLKAQLDRKRATCKPGGKPNSDCGCNQYKAK